jgi:hypothetical protein
METMETRTSYITMPLQTTTIGSYPKPEYLQKVLPDWFKNQNNYNPEEFNEALHQHHSEGKFKISSVTQVLNLHQTKRLNVNM